jgi:TonB family protein
MSPWIALWLSALGQEEPPITKLPEPKGEALAVYPEAALRDRISAVVVMELDIGADGAVEGITVVSSATIAEDATTSSTVADYGFVRAATTAVSRLEFEPAEAGGVAIPVRIGYSYRFELPPPPPPPVATSTAAPAPRVVSFSGTARVRGTRARLPGVVVTVFQDDRGFEAVTDGEGVFRFYDLAPGDWKVLAEADGYYPFRTAETIRAGEVVEATYYLEKGSYNPYDVLVEGKRIEKEVNRRTLAIAEVKVPGTLGDPILVVENLPGVARPPPGAGLVIVRGSGPENTGVYIDSIEVPLIYHFGGLRSVVPSEVIETVDFYPGNFPAFYGRVTGGIFDAHVKRLNPDQVHATLDVSLLDAGLYVEVPIVDGLAVAVAGRRSYVDAILNAVVPDDASVNLTTAPRYYDYQVLASWRPTNENAIRAVFLGSDDSIRILFENPAELDAQLSGGDLRARTHFDRFYAIWELTPAKEIANELRFAVGRDDVSTTFFTEFRFDINLLTFQVRDNLRWVVADALALDFGFDGIYRIVDLFIRSPRPPKEGDIGFNQDLDDVLVVEIDNLDDAEGGIYVDAEWTPLEGLAIVPGLRVDYYERVKQFAADPRLVARYRFLDRWTVKAGVGLVHQAPDGDETNEQFGNPDLSVERALQYSVGGEWDPTSYLSVDLTFFYNDLFQQVSRTGALDENGDPLVYDNSGRGRSYGMELFVRHDFHESFRGWLSYTLSRSERRDAEDGEYRLFSFDQTHILNVNLSYVFPSNWEVGLRFRLVSGNPYTPFRDSTYLSDFDRPAPIPGEVNSARYALFHQLDLRVEKAWIFDWFKIIAYLSLINAYNHANVEGLQYNFDYTETAPINGLPVLPILGIRGEL